jgi:hypothetical protein
MRHGPIVSGHTTCSFLVGLLPLSGKSHTFVYTLVLVVGNLLRRSISFNLSFNFCTLGLRPIRSLLAAGCVRLDSKCNEYHTHMSSFCAGQDVRPWWSQNVVVLGAKVMFTMCISTNPPSSACAALSYANKSVVTRPAHWVKVRLAVGVPGEGSMPAS